MQWMNRLRGAMLAVLSAASMHAIAINKCTVDGKVVFQDAPCEEQRETVREGLTRKVRVEEYHRLLDELAAQGEGRVQREHHKPPPMPAREDPRPPIHPRSRAMERELDKQWSARIQEETERRNAESAARLSRTLEEAQKGCGEKLAPLPTVGMTDAAFRNCTIHARFGGVTQIVAVERDGLALRLYIFPTQQARRVYSVGGVVTAIK